jgi:predicted TIM-barrel fold metal-dependent hydrolase
LREAAFNKQYAEGKVMLIVDSQVHLWGGGRLVTPESAHHFQNPAYTKDDLLIEMNAAGVDRVIIVPPGFASVPPGGTPNDHALMAARVHPDRFAVMGKLRLDQPEISRPLIPEWKKQPGMLGMRLVFNKEFRHLMSDGTADWVWPHLEEANIPVMLLVPGLLDYVETVAERHPGLRITIDHLAAPRFSSGPGAFTQMPQLLDMAKYPNVSVKVSGMPSNSVEPYPYRDVETHIRQAFEAYGPHRTFWGSDLTRMPCSYRECITHFTEELLWLNGEDKELVMGKAVCQWLDWPLPNESATPRIEARSA